jgi:hypothetical protein
LIAKGRTKKAKLIKHAPLKYTYIINHQIRSRKINLCSYVYKNNAKVIFKCPQSATPASD